MTEIEDLTTAWRSANEECEHLFKDYKDACATAIRAKTKWQDAYRRLCELGMQLKLVRELQS